MNDAPRKKRILVLDDDLLVRRAIVRAAATRNDLTLEAVGTPDELWARLAADEPFDVVVCDYRLKIDGRRMTSAALCRDLVSRGHLVLIMTGDLDGAKDVADLPKIEKPLLIDDLVRAVARLNP